MSKKAYTVVEMMVVIGIFTFLLASVYIILSSGRNTSDSLDNQAELNNNARMAMQDMIRNLSESSRTTVTKDVSDLIPSFTDPLNNQQHQILIFASARGDPGITSEENPPIHQSNNYVHLTGSYKPNWRSTVIYCTYVTSGGIQQLRKYVDYGSTTAYYSQAGIFPLSVTSITSMDINLHRGDGSNFSISRNSGKVIASYVASEDADNDSVLDANENDGNNSLPIDNCDGVLDRGAGFTMSSGRVNIKLFLAKSQMRLTEGQRFLSVTLTGSTEARNE